MNTPKTIDLPSIADRAMLLYVRISVWSARKLDKKQTGKTVKDAGATNDAARVNKHLFANADAKLREVQRAGNAIREYVEANTLPWDDAGNRIISNDRSLVVVGELENLRKAFDERVDEFIVAYPHLRAEAMTNLGDMADAEDYPPPEEVRAKFSVRYSFSPVSTTFGDVRDGMNAQQVSAWQKHLEANMRSQVASAFEASAALLREALEKYFLRLQLREDSSGKVGIFRDTMVEQLRHACVMLQTMNVFGDPRLATLAADIQQDIACHDPDALRLPANAVRVREDVGGALARLKSMLGE